MAKKHEDKVENTDEAARRVHHEAQQGDGPAAHDGTNTGDTHPKAGPEPGVTLLPEGDEDVPSFIPDEVGPRTAHDEKIERTVEDNAKAAQHPVERVAQNRAVREAEEKQAEAKPAPHSRTGKLQA